MVEVAVDHWSLDKRIPLALIMAIVLQTGSIAFYMGALSVRVSQIEERVLGQAKNSDRITGVEVQLRAIDSTLQRFERILEKVVVK